MEREEEAGLDAVARRCHRYRRYDRVLPSGARVCAWGSGVAAASGLDANRVSRLASYSPAHSPEDHIGPWGFRGICAPLCVPWIAFGGLRPLRNGVGRGEICYISRSAKGGLGACSLGLTSRFSASKGSLSVELAPIRVASRILSGGSRPVRSSIRRGP